MKDDVITLRKLLDTAKVSPEAAVRAAWREIERLRGFLVEIEAPSSMDEKTFFARQALDTARVTVHGPQCLCSRCEAQSSEKDDDCNG